MNIILLGSTGYIGSVFKEVLLKRGHGVQCVKHDELSKMIGDRADILINCAAHIPKPSVSICDSQQKETIKSNVILPYALAMVAGVEEIPIVHLSTACLFDDQKYYDEADTPRRGWNDHCGTYVGTKLLAEEMVSGYEKHYILRIRLPFDEHAGDRNYLSKIMAYPQVYDHLNSLTHRADFVNAALDLVALHAPYGIYNMVNPGSISARDILTMMKAKGMVSHESEFIPGPCPGCTLSVKKLLSTGVKIRSVHDAVEESLMKWKS